MANKLNYKVPLVGGEQYCDMTSLGGGRVGLRYYKGNYYTLGIVDIHDGSLVWEMSNYDSFDGGTTVPLCDENAFYAPYNDMHQNLAALNKETGEVLWKRYIGNGTNNFISAPVQTPAYVVTINQNASRLTVIDKTNGKIAAKAKMQRGIWQFTPCVSPWQDKLVVRALDKKKDQWTIDLYDPAVKEMFVKTLLRFPEKEGDDGMIRIQRLVNDSLFFFTREGEFCKLDLLTGETEKHALPEEGRNSERGWSYTTEYIHRHGDKLCAVGHFFSPDDDKMRCFSLLYDLKSGAFSAVLIADTTIHNMVFYEDGAYLLGKKGLKRWDVFGDGAVTETTFEDWPGGIRTDRIFEYSAGSGEWWLIAEGKLLAIREEDAEDGEKQGYLYCWEL